MKIILQIILVFIAVLWPLPNMAQALEADTTSTDSDYSVTVSLLTCSPGTLVYQLYGHTALRVREGRAGLMSDWVFNYGTFSFRQPHFAWRFALGETDYQLGVMPYNLFYEEYVHEGRAIFEQKLNLTQREAKRLADALAENVKPENATYRYNFFYDNCVTRAVAMVEKCIDGKVIWPSVDKNGEKSLRDIVHQYSESSPWNSFGQDLLLGSEADEPTTFSDQMFAPMYAENFVSQAKVRRTDGSLSPLAAPAITLLPAVSMPSHSDPLSPMWTFGILLAFTLILTVYEQYKKKNYWMFDTLLLVAQGLTGLVIAFLFFFSSHPAVGSNWLVVLFNPLPLLYFPWQMKFAANHRKAKGYYVEALMLLITLIIGVAGVQSFPLEVYIIIAVLAIRVVAQFRLNKR